jgi:Arc/MetJ family transcription regulator
VTVEKVSLSLDPELVAEARELTGRGGLSALVNDALRVRLQQVRISRLLDEMDEEFGPVPDEIAQEVAREWHEHDREAG